MDNQEDKSSSPVLHHNEKSEKQTIITTSQQTDHGGVDFNKQNPTTSSSETTPPLPDDTSAMPAVDLVESLKEWPVVVPTGKRGRRATEAYEAAEKLVAMRNSSSETTTTSPLPDDTSAMPAVDLAESLKRLPVVVPTGKRGRRASEAYEAAEKLVALCNSSLPAGPLLLTPDQNTTTEDSNNSSSAVSKNNSSDSRQSTANNDNNLKEKTKRKLFDEIEESGSGFTDGSG